MTVTGTTDAQRSVRAVLQREWGGVTDLLHALDDADWDRPTRCEGWTVLDLARHAVWGVSMEADAVRRANRGEVAPAEGFMLPSESRPAETLEALHRAAADLCAVVGDLGAGCESLVCPMPYGPTPLPVALEVFVFEAALHASDFADAVGRDRPLATDVVAPIARVLTGFLPALALASTADPPRGESFALVGDIVRLEGRWTDQGLELGASGPEPSVTVSGDDTSVLLFAVGRLPAEDPRLAVTGSVDLARRFKSFVPGP